MKKEQFDKIIEGLINPSKIKVMVNNDYDVLLSADNTNDTMEWFKTNADKLESNLREQHLEWAYAIETCPTGQPFIYMLISPTMSTNRAKQITQQAKNTLPEGRTMLVSSGIFRTFNIDEFDNTPTTLIDLLTKYADTVIEVTES